MVQREDLLREQVTDVELKPGMTLDELIDAYGEIYGFMAGHLRRAIEILSRCLRDADLRVLSFTANIVATGVRGILAQLIREKLFNLVVTTCGTIDHDVARGLGYNYYKGYFEADDKMLRELEIHRLGNIYIPVENYGEPIEKFTHRVLSDLAGRKKRWAVYEVLWEMGARINDKHSILRAAYEAKTPVIVPGFVDGAFGTAVFTFTQLNRDFAIDIMLDEELLADRFFRAKKAAALLIGGGISKHHSIWWAQFRGGFDCAVYVTTAVEYDGSLSGAQPREAISWGKIKPSGEHVVVYGDATILLPLIAYGLLRSLRWGSG
ncbi:deoxyhypusine synthase [Hyperthermus butylicus]|uniref:Deoxyhypusine synthase n=1 Tax=Hyperthermus butylicus (strain DSM 5456 / JCM 9403 / PLM1-5) TaxID=415426 RepID=A2BIV7_HYPBU|nr:deoxyhypusine synthase [Hyperthermus butylicus]ABM79918.1 Deoxyhypusine synthase [Hyperthermus butylicus DSM 5456]